MTPFGAGDSEKSGPRVSPFLNTTLPGAPKGSSLQARKSRLAGHRWVYSAMDSAAPTVRPSISADKFLATSQESLPLWSSLIACQILFSCQKRAKYKGNRPLQGY